LWDYCEQSAAWIFGTSTGDRNADKILRALRHAENVYLDTSGSVTDDGIVELAAETLGVDRLLFGCDMSFTAGVGKIRGSDLSAEQKQKILGGNLLRLLAEGNGRGK
jgi:predicted TIM-barrel fold metal-dependent hydrolase